MALAMATRQSPFRSEIDVLREENAQLRRTLEATKGTIDELQRALRDVSNSYLDELREMACAAQQ